MFARVVECQAMDGRGGQMSTLVTNDVLPILQERPGFADFLLFPTKPTLKACCALASGLPRKMLKSITAGTIRRSPTRW
jgi:hypothetical protein